MPFVLRVSQVLALSGVGGLLALSLLTIADVVGRLFGRPIPGFADIATLATAVIIPSFFPILLLRRGNITLRPFASFGEGGPARVLDAFGSLLTAIFMVLMAWQYVRFATEVTGSGERMAVLRWSVAPWWWAVAGMVAVTAVVAVAVWVTDLRGRGHNPGE
jgi:hypothetical protein